jgi:hypothetical protein
MSRRHGSAVSGQRTANAQRGRGPRHASSDHEDGQSARFFVTRLGAASRRDCYRLHMLRTSNIAVMAASAILLVLAMWHSNDLPGAIDFDPRLKDEPRQVEIHAPAVTLAYAGVTYRVEPLYDYELYGLVVSYRQHDGGNRLHRLWNDHLNVADVCVAWSDTAFAPTLRELDFWNGIFTCNVKTRDSPAWSQFRMHQLSNNHLISADPYVRDRVADIHIGDQIHIKGKLARYGAAGVAMRGTSTTRADTGNGACETILVDRFEIVVPGFNPWRAAMWVALATLVATLGLHFYLPHRPYRD